MSTLMLGALVAWGTFAALATAFLLIAYTQGTRREDRALVEDREVEMLERWLDAS